MNQEDLRFIEVKKVCSKAELWSEGGKNHVYLPAFKVASHDLKHQMDLLLCPYDRDGYTSRLFFQEQIKGKVSNWSTFNICGRTWYGYSWKGIPNDIPYYQMLLGHLGALT